MRMIILVAAAVLVSGVPAIADTAQCDAKPFTLNKPSPVPPKAPAPPKLAQAQLAKPLVKAAPASKPKGTSRLISDCKKPAGKTPG